MASSTTSGCRRRTRSPAVTRTRITVPGIGAVRALCSACGPCSAAASGSGGGAGGGAGRLRRNPPRQGRSGSRSGGAGGGGGGGGGAGGRAAGGARWGRRWSPHGAQGGVGDEPAQEGQVRDDAADLGLREGG